jgi:LptD protein
MNIFCQDTIPRIDFSISNDTIYYSSEDSTLSETDGHILTVEDDTIPKGPKVSENAVDTKVEYKAKDSIQFSVDAKKVYLWGDAEIIYGDIQLKSAYIEFNMNDNIVLATGLIDSLGEEYGKPEFVDNKESFTAKKIRYNFDTKRGVIDGVFSEQSDGYLHSGKTKKLDNDEFHLKKGKYTTCEHEHPHFYVALSKAKVIPDDKIISGPANIVIEDIPLPIGIPFGFFPNSSGRASGILIPQYGEEQNRGFYLRDGGYYFGISDKIDLTIKGETYSKGSWGLSALSRYKKRYKYNGNFSFNYTNLSIDDEGINQFNYKLIWRHTQDPKARPNSNFSADVNFGSSGYDKYNSRNANDYLQSTIQSGISFRKTFPNSPFNGSANIRHSQNNRDSIVNLTIPDLNLSMNRIYPFKKIVKSKKLGFVEKLGIQYTSNFKNTVSIRDTLLFEPSTLDKFRNGVQHNIPISTSFNAFKFFNISPSFTYKERWYFESINRYWDESAYYDYENEQYGYGRVYTDTSTGFNRVYDYNISAGLSTTLYGFYQFQASPIRLVRNSGLIAIRHKIDPSVSFSMRPDFSEGRWKGVDGFYDEYINGSGDTVKYSRYEGGIYGVPGEGRFGSLSFGINNNLEMKVANKKDTVTGFKKVSILKQFSVRSSYNIFADSLNWSTVNMTGSTSLFDVINLNFGVIYDPYAYDTIAGKKVSIFEYDYNGDLLRLTSANISINFSLNDKTFKSTPAERAEAGTPADILRQEEINYYDYFSVPWNLRFDYQIRFSQPDRLEPTITQTFNFSGDFSITKKWKVGFSSGYDIERREITFTNVNISRDLHCWMMTFRWVPFGVRQSYNFEIGVKASILSDLKYNKSKTFIDNL